MQACQLASADHVFPEVQADSLVYQTEKQLKELGDKVPAEIKTKVEAKVNELKEVAAKDDVEATKKALDELQKEVSISGLYPCT